MTQVSDSLKRAVDVFGAGAGLLLLSVPMAAVMLAILAAMGRPILFTQERAGRYGKPFRLLKFRSMREAGPDPWNPSEDVKRLTRLGTFLRRWSLDELPQLWNVLRGHMSLVGPRPLPVSYLSRYTPEQARRHVVRPGMTGWAQVHARNATTWPERFAMDLWYVDHRSLMLDLRILALTVGRVVSPQGISQPGRATMSEFTGNE